MQQTLKVEFLQDLEAELAQLPSYDLMLSILNKIHLATDEMMKEIPIYSLASLLVLAKSRGMQKAIAAIEREICLYIEAVQKMKLARQRAKEQKILADEAEQRAKRAEQWAKEVEALQQSIESRLNSIDEN